MDQKLNPLFTPWKIGSCEIKNRFVLTSMGGTDLFGWMENNHFDKDGAELELPCDSVISCAGYIPAPAFKKGGKVQLVGDCVEVGNLRSVIWRAYEAAMKI